MARDKWTYSRVASSDRVQVAFSRRRFAQRLTGSLTWMPASRSAAACGKRLSRQAFAILPKISEVDKGLRADSQLSERVREVHPEVCFYFLNNKQPMLHPKKSGQGYLDRYRLLESHFGTVIAHLRSQVPRRDAADDDLLDALVALWSGQRVRAGSHNGA